MFKTLITSSPILPHQSYDFIQSPDCGAWNIFAGIVRNHHLGKEVLSLEYECFQEMAKIELDRYAEEALNLFPVKRVYIAHRFGKLNIGDIAVLIHVASHHRDESFKASRFLIEKIKTDLPIWKREHYANKPAEWIHCSHHHGEH